MGGFFKWAYPKKPTGFFWVRTRVSEPWTETSPKKPFSRHLSEISSKKTTEQINRKQGTPMIHGNEICNIPFTIHHQSSTFTTQFHYACTSQMKPVRTAGLAFYTGWI